MQTIIAWSLHTVCLFVCFGDWCLECNQPKLRFPTNVGAERGQASFALCICFYILGACVYPYRGQDLASKPVCHWGGPSKQCNLEEMRNILLHLIDARSAWHTGFDAFTLQCL